MTVTSTDFPNNHVLLHFREELYKNPATFKKTRNLYYVAALVSIVVAVVFLGSAIALQKMILPFWTAILGSIVTVYAGHAFIELVGDMIQNAKKADKDAVCLKEMQDTYQSWQKYPFSEAKKIVILYYSFAKKKYTEIGERLKTLEKNISKSGSMLPPESKLKEVVQLQHQELLLKIDLSFKSAICCAFAKGKLNCLTKKEDLLIISDQDPWERYQIHGLNATLKNKFTKPLIIFKKFQCEKLSYEEVQEMPPNRLANHMFTLMKASITELI